MKIFLSQNWYKNQTYKFLLVYRPLYYTGAKKKLKKHQNQAYTVKEKKYLHGILNLLFSIIFLLQFFFFNKTHLTIIKDNYMLSVLNIFFKFRFRYSQVLFLNIINDYLIRTTKDKFSSICTREGDSNALKHSYFSNLRLVSITKKIELQSRN